MDNATSYEDFGSYRLTHLLGKGGMASVYRAVRSGPMGFAKEVAIKRIHDALVDNEAILKGLINEARIGGQLKHPHIVEIYEFNKVGEAYYLAMEFVDGWTLDKVVKLARELRMPVPPSVVLQIGVEICAGLDYAHNLESLEGVAVKLVHRDLKPANLILSRYGTTKIMDFGIAKAETNLFKTSMADVTKGTPHYMSPEQVAGADDLSGTSDLFALGALLYELIIGKVLFVGDTLPTVLFNVVKAEVGPQIAAADERVPGIGPLLEGLLKKDPTDRPQTAAEVGAALGQLSATDFGGGPTIKQYLYSLRSRMMLGVDPPAPAASGETTVGDETINQSSGEPEFATLLAPSQLPEPDANEGLVEARRVADAAIGVVGKVFASTKSRKIDTSSETLAKMPSEAGGVPGPIPPLGIGADAGVAPATNPNQKKTRKIPRNVAKKKGSPAMLLLAVLLGLILAGTLLWVINERVFSGTPTVVEEPDTDAAVDLSMPDIELPQEGDPSTPKPRIKSDPKPARSVPPPTPTPAPDPTPAPVGASTSVPPPEPSPAVEPITAAPNPTPAPVAVIRPTGRGRVSIKFSKPYYARVWVDGIDTGRSTPVMGLEVPAGKHRIELVADEQGRRSSLRTVNVAANGHVKLGHYDFDTDSWEE